MYSESTMVHLKNQEVFLYKLITVIKKDWLYLQKDWFLYKDFENFSIHIFGVYLDFFFFFWRCCFLISFLKSANFK